MASPQLIRVRASGAPRAVGAAQARAWRAARRDFDAEESPLAPLRRAADWVLRWGGRSLTSPLSWEQRQALTRDLRRHFPHFAERAQALVRGAGCGPIWNGLVEPRSRAFAMRVDANGPTGLRCALPAKKRWLLRDIESEGGYRTCGITVPWAPANLAGINEAGLCGAVEVDAPLLPSGNDAAPEAGVSVPAIFAPGWLLLDQCLERCDRVDRALAWCRRRPGGGRTRLFFADARGDRAELLMEGTQRAIAAAATRRFRAVEDALEIHLDPATRSLLVCAPGGAPLASLCATEELGQDAV